ncbi:MAG: alanine racemase [Pseudomonadales bacterium]|nr:alanine racemase [Gammaproteobacteria bacterium]NNL56906.1 alanine racemase [Pseudomonadales bacterium]
MPEPELGQLRHATAYIDRAALRQNAKLAQSLAPQAQMLCMVKAEAYGHGMLEVARVLEPLADAFGVARLQEGILLRDSGCNRKIVLFSHHFTAQDFALAKKYKLTPGLFAQHNIAEQINCCCDAGLHYWLKLDTGMHRLGLPTHEHDSFELAVANADRASEHCDAVITHLHSADANDLDSAEKQLQTFNHAVAGMHIDLLNTRYSIANSAALLQHTTAAQRAKWLRDHIGSLPEHNEIIRPGIMLYGADPLACANTVSRLLKPVMTLAAPVIDLKRVPRGASVGYAADWVAKQDSVIATVAIGYGDGYPRHAPNGTPVLINGALGALAGRVSMDMIGVDITALLEHGHKVKIGDPATLWGNGLAVEGVADKAATISYQLLTGVTQRVERLYIN